MSDKIGKVYDEEMSRMVWLRDKGNVEIKIKGIPNCEICGEPMPEIEGMFNSSGHSCDTDTPRTDAAADYTAPEHLHRLCKELERELSAAQKRIGELEAVIAGVASYLEGDPTFTKADEVLDKVNKIAAKVYGK